jgi:lysyl-tRNA synthetase class 2
MPSVDSSALSHISYNRDTRVLRAIFRDSGRVYIYQDVPPDIYAKLLASPSIGTYFNSHIRDQFPFQELPPVQLRYKRR